MRIIFSFYLETTHYAYIFVFMDHNKVKAKSMEKAKKSFKAPFVGFFLIIAVRVNCTPTYVSMVLNDNLGKYTERDTELVKQIRTNAEEITQLLRPQK